MKKGSAKQAEAFVTKEEDENLRTRKLTLKMDDEGDIAWDGVEPEQKASVIAAMLNDPDAQEAFGATRPGIGDIAEAALGAWDETDAAFMINVVGMVNTKLFQRLKIDGDIAAQCASFTPEQHAVLDPRGAKLLNKWLPGDFLYKDELMFLGAISQMVMSQLAVASELQKQRNGGETINVEPIRVSQPQKVDAA